MRAREDVSRVSAKEVRYFDQQPRSRTATLDAVLPFLRLTSPPQRVVSVIEALLHEGVRQ